MLLFSDTVKFKHYYPIQPILTPEYLIFHDLKFLTCAIEDAPVLVNENRFKYIARIYNLLYQWQTLSSPGPIQPRVQPTSVAPARTPRVAPAAPSPPAPSASPRVMPPSPPTPSPPAPHNSNCTKVTYICHTNKGGPPPYPRVTSAMPPLSLGFPCPPHTSELVARRT